MDWDFLEQTNTMNFMDLTITITDGKISTTLFEKLLNVHGYITPHSAHAPGVLHGLISGNISRIYSLCSDATERKRLIASFYHRLLRRGYQPPALLPKFTRARQLAEDNSRRPTTDDTPTEKTARDDTTIFLHSAYHPNNPSSAILQNTWRQAILDPPSRHILPRLRNNDDRAINLRRMIIA